MSPKYTEYLLSKYDEAFRLGTQHPFLRAAGEGTLSKDLLQRWVRQDYLYAYIGYVKFASTLVSRLPIPSTPPSSDSTPRQRTIEKLVKLLIFSLQNILDEVEFFTSTARDHGMDLHPTKAINGPDDPMGLLGVYEETTRAYVDFLHSVACGGTIEEGVVVLWIMEKSYLDAWTYAKSCQPSTPPSETEAQKASSKYIERWSSEDMQGFVKQCEEAVDGLEIDKDGEVGARCEEADSSGVQESVVA